MTVSLLRTVHVSDACDGTTPPTHVAALLNMPPPVVLLDRQTANALVVAHSTQIMRVASLSIRVFMGYSVC